MANKQKLETCTLDFPITIDLEDLDLVEQVVEEAFIREPKRPRRRA
ncbi:MAG: hypothetical protein ACM3UL_05360 [Ignavibacteria bacterium]